MLAYVEREDTPRSLAYQLDLLRAVGFAAVEVRHKNCCFAAFGAVKGGPPAGRGLGPVTSSRAGPREP